VDIINATKHLVRVNWYHSVNTDYNYDKFNNIYIIVMEHFGLPSNARYQCKFYEGYVIFVFNDEKDALMCNLLLSEYL